MKDDIRKIIHNIMLSTSCGSGISKETAIATISALEELRRYRRIGTINECAGYKIYRQNIGKLHDCNDCGRKGNCEIEPRYGDYCRINCCWWRSQK